MAAVAGCEPGPLTLRELSDRERAARRWGWDQATYIAFRIARRLGEKQDYEQMHPMLAAERTGNISRLHTTVQWAREHLPP